MNTPLELAKGLQHSNVKEVSDLAKAYLILCNQYASLERDFDMLEDDLNYVQTRRLKNETDSNSI
jgi:hypothetical protein